MILPTSVLDFYLCHGLGGVDWFPYLVITVIHRSSNFYVDLTVTRA